MVAGVCCDKDVLKYKGKFVSLLVCVQILILLKILDESVRLGSVRACKWVDEVVFPAPWFPNLELLDKHNIDFAAHDALPYVTSGVDDCYKQCKEAGRFLPTLRTQGLSTTDILTSILKDRVNIYLSPYPNCEIE